MNLLETPTPITTSEKLLRSATEKFLTFKLGSESYGIAVLKVREIIRMQNVTHLPQLPAHILGIINLRGKVIPVLSLRRRFELPHQEASETNCIIVVQIRLKNGDDKLAGLEVDSVEEVFTISENDVEPSPDFGNGITADYILGIAKVKNAVKTLLDIEKVMNESSIETISTY